MATGIEIIYNEHDLEKLKNKKAIINGPISLYLSCSKSAGSTLVIEKSGKAVHEIDLFKIINETQICEQDNKKIRELIDIFNGKEISSHDAYFTKKDDTFSINTCFIRRNIYYLHSLPVLFFVTEFFDVDKIGEKSFKENKELYKRLFLI